MARRAQAGPPIGWRKPGLVTAGVVGRVDLTVGSDPRNAVPVIDKLVQRRLVRRQPDPTDRRRNTVTLTAAGRTTLRELRRAGEQVEQQLLDGLTITERADLRQVLLKLLLAVGG
jgi:DNA-binding MarR family transcriptional regulator